MLLQKDRHRLIVYANELEDCIDERVQIQARLVDVLHGMKSGPAKVALQKVQSSIQFGLLRVVIELSDNKTGLLALFSDSAFPGLHAMAYHDCRSWRSRTLKPSLGAKVVSPGQAWKDGFG